MSAVLTTPKRYVILCTRPDDSHRNVVFQRYSRLMDAIKIPRRLRSAGLPAVVRRVVTNDLT